MSAGICVLKYLPYLIWFYYCIIHKNREQSYFFLVGKCLVLLHIACPEITDKYVEMHVLKLQNVTHFNRLLHFFLSLHIYFIGDYRRRKERKLP
jgi:hypothetical protein